MIKRTELSQKLAGQYTTYFPHYYTEHVYNNVPINHVLPYDRWYYNTRSDIEKNDRFEYAAFDENDKVVAAMCIVKDYDTAVGDCLIVQYAYSNVPGALRGGYKIAFKLAKKLGFKHVITTHLVKGKDYTLRYREVGKHPTKPKEFGEVR